MPLTLAEFCDNCGTMVVDGAGQLIDELHVDGDGWLQCGDCDPSPGAETEAIEPDPVPL